MDILMKVREFLKECKTVIKTAAKQWRNADGYGDVYLSAMPSDVTLTARHQDGLVIQQCKSIKVRVPGVCYIPAKELRDALVGFARAYETVRIRVGGSWAYLTHESLGHGSYKIAISDELTRIRFPFAITVVPEAVINVSALTKVIKAAGQKDSRYILNAVYFDLREGRLIATDGHRMHLSDAGTKADFAAVVSIQIVNLVKEVMRGDIEIGRYKDKIFFRNNNTTIITNRLEGKYPNCHSVITGLAQSTNSIKTSRIQLMKAVKLTGKSGNNNTISCYIRDGRLVLYGVEPEISELTRVIDCQYSGDLAAGFAVNYKYLYQSLAEIKSREVTLRFGILLPIGIYDTESSDKVRSIVMPMQRGNDKEYSRAPEDALYQTFPPEVTKQMNKVKMENRILRKLEIARKRDLGVKNEYR